MAFYFSVNLCCIYLVQILSCNISWHVYDIITSLISFAQKYSIVFPLLAVSILYKYCTGIIPEFAISSVIPRTITNVFCSKIIGRVFSRMKRKGFYIHPSNLIVEVWLLISKYHPKFGLSIHFLTCAFYFSFVWNGLFILTQKCSKELAIPKLY